MFARVPIFLALLLAGQSTLQNGVRVGEVSPGDDAFEVVAGYRAGLRNETGGLSGLSAVIGDFLSSSVSARELALTAYATGGEIEFFNEPDRTGFRLKVPEWARPMVENSIAAFLDESPARDPAGLEHAMATVRARSETSEDFRAKVEDEIRLALLGPMPYSHPSNGWKSDHAQIQARDLESFFEQNYGTDRAFVLMNGSQPASLRELASRPSRELKSQENRLLKAVRTIRFQDQEGAGAVIFTTPVTAVFYRGWYAVLLLDRLIQRALPGDPITRLVPAFDPFYYRVEVPVPEGQFADAVQDNLMQELERLQYVRATDQTFAEARESALQFLESPATQHWFESLGIPERRLEGIEWVRSFSPDDIRATVRDLLLSNRVIASWSPKPKELRIQVESLDDPAPAAAAASPQALPELRPAQMRPFAPHPQDATDAPSPAERLPSGVSIVASSAFAIFAAPDSFKMFEREPGREVMDSYAAYRPDRILVLAPEAALDRVRQQWAGFQGNSSDTAAAGVQGAVTRADLPALVLMKVLVDRKLIETGLHSDVRTDIRAAAGSRLVIEGSDEGRRRVLEFIAQIASGAVSEQDLEWAREAAIHRMDRMLPDLQSLVWQWDPLGTFADVRFVTAEHIRDVARIYFG